jgi:sterol 14-demethylase
MGVLADVSGPIGNFTANSSTPVVIAVGFASFLVLAVVLNVLQQLLLKNPNEPPVVFHLFPVIGSTVTYGMDPYKFFFAQQKKVCRVPCGNGTNALTGSSTAMSSLSFSSVAR